MRSLMNNGYHDSEEKYEDQYNDYDDDQFEESDAEEEDASQAVELSREQREFLNEREKLKERIRLKMKMQVKNTLGYLPRVKPSGKDNFGSFFGPSQPVIASRVIQEHRTSKDMQKTVSASAHFSSKNNPSSSKPGSSDHNRQDHQKPKVSSVSLERKKALALKNNRDFSFLFSDDGDLPASTKDEPTSRNATSSKSGPQSSRPQVTSNSTAKNPQRQPLKGTLSKNLSSASKEIHRNEACSYERKQNQPPTHRLLNGNVSKGSSSSMAKATSVREAYTRTGTSGERQAVPTTAKKAPSYTGKASTRPPETNSYTGKLGHDPPLRKDHLTLRPNTSLQNKHPQSQTKRAIEEQGPVRAGTQRSGSASKPQPSRTIAPQKNHNDHSKKKAGLKRPRYEEEDDDPEDAMEMLRQLTGYDPSRFTQEDDDTEAMVSNFHTIEREEFRSARVAKREDEEQLKLIMEEERREKERMMRRKQKQRQ